MLASEAARRLQVDDASERAARKLLFQDNLEIDLLAAARTPCRFIDRLNGRPRDQAAA